MKAKHTKATVKIRTVAKRAFALVFAAVLLCGCLLSVFASGPSLVDTIKDAESTVSDAGSTASDTGTSSGYMSDFAAYYASISSKTTYRFWLQETDELSKVKNGTLALSDCTDFYTTVEYKDGEMLEEPSGFETPIDPTGEGRTFEGWYYYDSDGKKQTFTFDGFVLTIVEDSTIDVFAKWKSTTADADSTKSDADSTKTDETKKSADSTTSDEQKYQKWYDEIMACEDTDQLAELYEKYVLDEGFVAYVNTLSEEKQQALSEKLSAGEILPYGGQGGGNQGSNVTGTFNFDLSNVDIIYYHFTSSNNDVPSEPNGSASADASASITFESSYYKTKNNYWLFFVKPKNNYMITGLGATGNGDIYSTEYKDLSYYGNIQQYPNLMAFVEKARNEKYTAVFGYMRTAGELIGTQSAILRAQQPTITVSADSNKTIDVKPKDNLTFTVTITPGHTTTSDGTYIGRDTVESVTINSLIINGVEYKDSCTALVENSDGTYTTTVSYTATQEDCNNGSVELKVDASVKYAVEIGVSSNHKIITETTITSSASTECLIAPQSQVRYKTTIADDAPINGRPEAVANVPHDQRSYYKGETVTVDTTYPTMKSVWDATNGGVWTFDGWYLGNDTSKKVTTATMTEDGLTFTGTWSFTKTTSSFTITKKVTGNLGDLQKEFDFTIKVTDNSGSTPTFKVNNQEYTGTANSIKLKHDGSVSLTNVPYGATVTITETDADGYTTTAKLGETSISRDSDNEKSFTVTVGASAAVATASLEENAEAELVLLSEGADGNTIAEGDTITITNHKELDIPTGILLDTLPYLLMLAAVGMGTVVLVVRRRNRPLRHG